MNSFHLFLIFSSCLYASLSFLHKVFPAAKVYMLIANLKIAKHSQHIPVRAYHLNADANDSQWSCQSLENWKL